MMSRLAWRTHLREGSAGVGDVDLARVEQSAAGRDPENPASRVDTERAAASALRLRACTERASSRVAPGEPGRRDGHGLWVSIDGRDGAGPAADVVEHWSAV